MSPRLRSISRRVLSRLVLLLPVACSSGDGPFAGTWTGPASYTATAADASQGLAGSASLTVVVTDANENEDGTEALMFTFAPGCVVPGRRTSNHLVHGGPAKRRPSGLAMIVAPPPHHPVFVDGTAEVGNDTPTQCQLPLDNGTMTFVLQDGTAHVTASGEFDVTLSGPLHEWDGNSPESAYVTVHFASQR